MLWSILYTVTMPNLPIFYPKIETGNTNTAKRDLPLSVNSMVYYIGVCATGPRHFLPFELKIKNSMKSFTQNNYPTKFLR